ncbi:PREDICTED: uncharacterized protein LOC109474307 [Branchiostoma belcheri]|uniref:NAD(+) hydrolase SARM1 n=1 Tax=Branchiostoma belcheri TaxID=7741 RepID=A0A6P4YL17_BRABE|nr:PREDICTED: uncharacterized protein LOC109474307 [Branchiostoma belcheri]
MGNIVSKKGARSTMPYEEDHDGEQDEKAVFVSKGRVALSPPPAEDDEQGEKTAKKPPEDLEKREFTSDLARLRKEMATLHSMTDFTTSESTEPLTFLFDIYKFHKDKARFIGEELNRLDLAGLFCKAWKSLHEVDPLREEVSKTNLKKLKGCLWNFTDQTPALCEALGKTEAFELLLSDLKNPELDVDSLKSHDKRYLMKGNLGILLNSVRLCTDNKAVCREANAVELLTKYLSSKYYIIKTKAILTLAYIVNDDENDKLNASVENIRFILKLLRAALEQPDHRAKTYNFSASELVSGLNELASNDGNKVKIVEEGGLTLLYQLLLDGSSLEENILAAKGLWILAFNKSNKEAIKKTGCVEALKALQRKTTDKELKEVCAGALWEINGGGHDRSLTKTTAEGGHVMISYQWDVQPKALVVKENLTKAGYRVWMDVEQMGGDILEAMAEAVEGAAVVLICMTEKYKDSPNCRTEAEYTHKLRKDIVPLRLQPRYDPDGWLGALVGMKLYFDLSTEDRMNENMDGFIKELGDRGRGERDSTDAGFSPVVRHIAEVQGTAKSSSVASWSKDDVTKWLTDIGMDSYHEIFRDYDGQMIVQLRKLSVRAPEFYYSSLKSDLGLKDLSSVLKFTSELERLS